MRRRCSSGPPVVNPRAYSTVWECVQMIGYDSSSELPGIYLGTSWTERCDAKHKERKTQTDTPWGTYCRTLQCLVISLSRCSWRRTTATSLSWSD
jgi:hypothetical protein